MILILGDIHGLLRKLMQDIKRYDITDCIIIQVGDFGYALNERRMSDSQYRAVLRYYNNRLKSRNIKMYVVRGNHDNPKHFQGHIKYSNIELLPDYSIIEHEGEKILLVGGAISIDRRKRMNEDLERNDGWRKWFEGEQFIFDIDKIKHLRDIDIVVTHTRPSIFNISYDNIRHYLNEDNRLENDINVEAKMVYRMWEHLIQNNTIRKWYYGHFHSYAHGHHMGTDFYCAPKNEFIEHR